MTLFASLPMYDLPEIRASTDLYWQRLAESMSDHGVCEGSIPNSLKRDSDPHGDWLDPQLLFSQTCGLPYVRDLRNRVTLLGSPAYDIDCAPGSYFSVLIVNADADEDRLGSAANLRFAYNDKRSQSGFAAYFSTLYDNGVAAAPGQMIESGAHWNSINLVAQGKTDIAAIDAVTFALAKRHNKATHQVRIIAKSEVTPSLPYISGLAFYDQREVISKAIVEAMAGLPETVRDDLLITGFNDRLDVEYDGIKTRWDELVSRGQHLL